MAKTLETVYKYHSLIYKGIIYLLTVASIVFFFPRGGKFKYEFQKGKTWQYENLYAPFDFSINKSEAELQEEYQELKDNQVPYYRYDSGVAEAVLLNFEGSFTKQFPESAYSPTELRTLRRNGELLVGRLFEFGIVRQDVPLRNAEVYLIRENEAVLTETKELIKINEVDDWLSGQIQQQGLSRYISPFRALFFEIIQPNVELDQDLTQKELENNLAEVSLTRGNVDEGSLIIARGEVVEAANLKILESLKQEYESELWSEGNYYLILFGYTILVALVLIMLLLFLHKYRYEIYRNNVKVFFIFFNVLLMVFLTTLVVKYNDTLVYVVPLCILPLILKTFFDARLGLFVHVLTVLILGFVVPNSFEYIFLQIIAGVVTILTVSQLYKRVNLFISVGQITLIYMVGYFAFFIIQEGSLENISWFLFGIFFLNGMITLFAQPLIYIYEKMFGMVSDVSLLELSDTNSRLLKELGNKAPGTFNHSLQVANLAEAAANEIGANAMLVRVGALYHDIGKMNNPTYFTENQTTNVNPHNDLDPAESARIIIGHVIGGIELARKYNLPDRVIDFIRVHHGTTYVYYFLKKAKELDKNVNEDDFRYPGPIPFSRETAILMMADAVEAASKSLVNPTYSIINDFVDKIIGGQMQANQFLNADITFKEIEAIKKVLKHRLTNIYHLRVEYPE